MISNQPEFSALDEMIAAAPDAPVLPAMQTESVPTMSSLQIAEITGKDHRNVMRDIRETLEQAEISALKFERSYKGGNGKDLPCYHLPRRECDLVVSGYSVKYRLAIIDRWHALEEKQAASPINLNDPAFLRSLLLDNVEKVIALETTVSELTPKADALDRLSEADGLMNITNAAKVLQMRPKALFGCLACEGWIYRRNGSDEWVPYQHRIQSGHMVAKAHTITNQVTGEQIIKERALLTAKGIAHLAKHFSKTTRP